MNSIRLTAIQQALEEVPRRCAVCGVQWSAGALCQIGPPGKPGSLKRLTHTWEADLPALAALVESWVGPLEIAVQALHDSVLVEPLDRMTARALLAALPWRAPVIG